MTRDTLLTLGPRALLEVLREGHPVDPSALDDTEYDGTALGLPGFVDRIAWKKFRKVFQRDPASGRLRGWNARCEQTPLDQPWQLTKKAGAPITYGYYSVLSPGEHPTLRGFEHALLIHYGRGAVKERAMRFVLDPLLALDEGSAERLLGFSYVEIGPARVRTPSFFLLERAGPLSHQPVPPGGWR